MTSTTSYRMELSMELWPLALFPLQIHKQHSLGVFRFFFVWFGFVVYFILFYYYFSKTGCQFLKRIQAAQSFRKHYTNKSDVLAQR